MGNAGAAVHLLFGGERTFAKQQQKPSLVWKLLFALKASCVFPQGPFQLNGSGNEVTSPWRGFLKKLGLKSGKKTR